MVLWTGDYLSSIWCTEELGNMLVREQKTKLRTAAHPHGIVIPAFIHDGENFPPDLGHIQHFEIKQCFNVRMARFSPRAEELAAALGNQAKAIAACIKNAPPWRPAWPRDTARKFFRRFHQQVESEQTTVPRFTVR
jgi:hypothetical protein